MHIYIYIYIYIEINRERSGRFALRREHMLVPLCVWSERNNHSRGVVPIRQPSAVTCYFD